MLRNTIFRFAHAALLLHLLFVVVPSAHAQEQDGRGFGNPLQQIKKTPSSDKSSEWGHEYWHEIPVYVDSIQASLTYPLAWGNCATDNFDEWRQKARAKVLECMMEAPPRAASYDVRVIGEEQREGYRARKIEFALSRWYRVKAYVLIPDGNGPFPAVNLLHDHGAHLSIGKEKMIRPFAVDSAVVADADGWVQTLYEGQYLGDFLARHGYVVFSTDAPLWGERGRKEGVDRSKYDIIAGNMMMLGRDLSAFMTYDDMAATDFLATLPEVDAARIGCAGCSMGGYRAWMLAALSDRVKAGACICWMGSTFAQLSNRYGRKENGGFANSIPALRQYLDYPHIASMACPKAMLFVAGTNDKLFPLEGVEAAFNTMHSVWQSQHADDRLETHTLEQPHECNLKNQQMILEFFSKHLKE
ncbi:MAG: prolyl oligopeptidase family serine peptidase [Prevotella sp.]|nr:prolyl oligopeptidase family serine peptidase [Prevotella sp.]